MSEKGTNKTRRVNCQDHRNPFENINSVLSVRNCPLPSTPRYSKQKQNQRQQKRSCQSQLLLTAYLNHLAAFPLIAEIVAVFSQPPYFNNLCLNSGTVGCVKCHILSAMFDMRSSSNLNDRYLGMSIGQL